jgi:hypothetical protein
MKKDITTADKYGPAMEITDQAEASEHRPTAEEAFNAGVEFARTGKFPPVQPSTQGGH